MASQTSLKLSAVNDDGKSVDWWFIYKIPHKSLSNQGDEAKGTEYIYYDDEFPRGEKLVLSNYLIDDPNHGALSNTLNQLFHQPDNKNLGWFLYNDEDPLTNKTNSNRGHTKGVLAFDLETNSAFWLIHSTPKFTKNIKYEYPTTSEGNGQTFLCISLKNAEEASRIASQMYQGQQPNVFAASSIPMALQQSLNDPRVLLMKDEVQSGDKAYADSICFLSAAGKQFLSIAKNKHWNKTNDDDFYNDLVAIKLNENLEVETWEHGKTPEALDGNSNHKIVGAKEVDLSPLKITPSFKWSEENDHAKLAISEKTEKTKYVCVGDLNFTVAQEKRSGGTVAFPSEGLWESLWEIISPQPFNKKKKPTT